MANREDIRALKRATASRDTSIWRKWWLQQHKKNALFVPDLSGSDLRNERLLGIDFFSANLIGADLRGAEFQGANLSMALLTNADLRGAHINVVDLSSADLSSANLEGANLRGSYLLRTLLDGTNLTNALIGPTVFADVDLSSTKGLETIKHMFPSTIGVDTIYKSRGRIPELFLRRAGVPENLIAFMQSLAGQSKAFNFYSCFISHSAKDQGFCDRLYTDLQAKGVRVWYFPEDAKWGETVWGEIDRSIKVYDKLIVVCSENSLRSGPVNREIERALNREDKEGKNILFPITLDRYVFDTWEHERKADVLRKVVGDFSGWDKDAAKYDKAFDKLLKGLQAAG